MSSTLQARVSTQPVLFGKVWQHPYVDVLRQVGAFEGRHSRVVGDVKRMLDPTLNKQVLCIRGSVSAANFIELPGPGTNTKEQQRTTQRSAPSPGGRAPSATAAAATSLGLTGEYMYLQIRAVADKFFVIHVDVQTAQGLIIRLSISNIFKHIKLMNHGRVLQLPCDFLSTKWTVIALHFPSLLNECSNNVQSMHAINTSDGSSSAAHGLKYVYSFVHRIQLCSSLYVKNVITSSHRYSIASFPKEAKFFVGRGYSFDDFYEWFWIVTPPNKATARAAQIDAEEAHDEQQQLTEREEADAEAEVEERQVALERVGEARPVTEIRSQSLPADAQQRLYDPHGRQPRTPVKASVPVHVLGCVDVQQSPSQAQSQRQSAQPSRRASTSSAASAMQHNGAFNAHAASAAAAPSASGSVSAASAHSNRPLTAAEFDDRASEAGSAARFGGGGDDGNELDPSLAPLVGGVGAAADASVPTHSPVEARRAQAFVEADRAEYESGGEEQEDGGAADAHAERQRRIDDAALASSRALAAASVSDSALSPDPILSLDKIIGYSASRTSRNLCWSPCGEYMIYPSNNVLIIAHAKTGAQEFLTGHTAPINLVSVSSNGIIATGQEGKQALIRLWSWEKRACVGILMAHNSDLRCLSFSYLNLMLAAVGRDAQGRVLVVVWDVSSLLESGAVHIVAKQISDFGINRIQFSPFREDPLHLISCGHESIRFWRIKTRHLPGSSLQLNEHARNTFTEMAFEAKYGEADTGSKRLYVATAAGSLFQINYATRQLECIYKLHSGPIYSLSLNEGFCVTGSGDCFLRVWPLDFSDYMVQAQHKGAVTAVQMSVDGLQVLVGSDNGCIGVMDLSSTAYQTRVRSHLDTIYACAFDPHRDEFATVSKDGTIRIFGVHSLEQIYEFYSPHESVLCVAYHPLASEYRVACGFASGSVRVMDIATTTMHVDYQQHVGRVLDVVFSGDGAFLYSNGEDGNICAYDVAKNYCPVRMFTTYRNQPVPLPPSVIRSLHTDADRSDRAATTARRIKEQHDARSPFLSHHLDRAREEAHALDHPTPLPHHSQSHARHCGGGDGAGHSHSHGAPLYSYQPSAQQGASILPAHALSINSDGSLLATIGADPSSIVLLSTDTLRQVRLLSTMAASPVAKLIFATHAPELVAVLADSSFQRFGLAEGNLIAHVTATPTMKFRQERALAAPARESGLAFAAAGAVSLPNSGAVCTSAALSPLSLFLLTGSSEPLVRVWDFGSKPHAPHFQSLLAHQSPLAPAEGVTSLTFSPDGRRLVSTGGDAVWVWRLLADEAAIIEGRRRRARRAQEEEERMAREEQMRHHRFDQSASSMGSFVADRSHAAVPPLPLHAGHGHGSAAPSPFRPHASINRSAHSQAQTMRRADLAQLPAQY